jgi:hypothetical protein
MPNFKTTSPCSFCIEGGLFELACCCHFNVVLSSFSAERLPLLGGNCEYLMNMYDMYDLIKQARVAIDQIRLGQSYLRCVFS